MDVAEILKGCIEIIEEITEKPTDSRLFVVLIALTYVYDVIDISINK